MADLGVEPSGLDGEVTLSSSSPSPAPLTASRLAHQSRDNQSTPQKSLLSPLGAVCPPHTYCSLYEYSLLRPCSEFRLTSPRKDQGPQGPGEKGGVKEEVFGVS